MTSVTERRSDWDDAHTEILEAAYALFLESGPEAVTMSAVADASGLNRTTVHRHFATRTALRWAVTQRVVEDMGVRLSGAIDDTSLDTHVDEIVASFVADPERARSALIELAQGVAGDGSTMLAGEQAMMAILGSSGRGRKNLDPDVLAIILLAGTLLWSARAGGSREAAPRFALEVKRLLMHGALDPDAFEVST